MEKLQVSLKVLIANCYAMYFKAHGFHWNVEGRDFAQYHDFFGEIYTEVFGAIDKIAEELRAIEGYAPANMQALSDMTTIVERDIVGTNLVEMLTDLQAANNAVIESLNECHKLAEGMNNRGLVNLLEDRLDTHAKHAWMIRASLKA